MAEQGEAPTPKAPPKPKRKTKYVVFEVHGETVKPVNIYGGEVRFPEEVPIIEARTSQEARDKAFAHLTAQQMPEQQDDFKAPLVALPAGGWTFEEMAWKVKREIAR